MAKYLNETGLRYFWQKIIALFYTKTEVDNLIVANAVTASYDGNGTVTISGISTLPDASTQSY